MTYTIKVFPDPHLDKPEDAWRLYSFGTRHASYRDPETLGLTLVDRDEEPEVDDLALAEKLATGYAHFLSYFEHGDCIWFLADGYAPPGVEFRWDGVRYAGLLVWEDEPVPTMTREDLAKDAAIYLDAYTAWCNGEGYGFVIEDETGECIDSCCGYYGSDLAGMASAIREAVGDSPYVLNELAADLIGPLPGASRAIA